MSALLVFSLWHFLCGIGCLLWFIHDYYWGPSHVRTLEHPMLGFGIIYLFGGVLFLAMR